MYHTKFIWPALFAAGLLLVNEGHHFLHPDGLYHKKELPPPKPAIDYSHPHEERPDTGPTGSRLIMTRTSSTSGTASVTVSENLNITWDGGGNPMYFTIIDKS